MLISVIVPIYNTAPYLPKCLDSILAQTHRDLEILLIDDGSEDNSGAICDEYAKKDQRIKVIHQSNAGLSSARNAGLDAATGAYIAFVDSDDYILPEMFAAMLAAIEWENADLAICGIKSVDENGREVWKHTFKNSVMDNKQALRAMSETIPPSACHKLYKYSLWQDLRFPPGRLMEDFFTHHHIIGKCQKIITLEDIFYIYLLQRQGSIMSTHPEKRLLDFWDAIYDRYLFFKDKGKGFSYCRRHSVRGLCSLLTEILQNFNYAEQQKVVAPLYKKTLWLLVKYGDLRAVKLLLYRYNPAFAKRLDGFIEPLVRLYRQHGKMTDAKVGY